MESTSVHKQTETVLEGFNDRIKNVQLRNNGQFLLQHLLRGGNTDITGYV